MTEIAALDCRVQNRRRKLFGNKDWNGIDFLEVSADQRSLCVHFFGHVPLSVTAANVRIEGGRRIRGIRAVGVKVDPANNDELDDCLRISLDKPGDCSVYRLCLINAVGGPMAGLDPRYACLDFTFKIDCPSDLDCADTAICLPEPLREPAINYLAKDYASFQQLIFDRLALIMPDWRERHAPDLMVTLVELLAYTGDYLSYYQDAVATEAYLDTARQRISVRRHLRLIDYTMHEGCNARAWVTVATSSNFAMPSAEAFYFITGFPDIKAASGNVVKAEDLAQTPAHLYEVFEPVAVKAEAAFQFYAAHSEIHFYTWGDGECCLAKGATRATLRDQNGSAERILKLGAGDALIFEEVIGPMTGNAADADPARRHAVRLTACVESYDALLDTRVLEIEWGAEDALPFSLCLSSRLPPPDCSVIGNICVARGNAVLVDHGRKVSEPLGPVGAGETLADCACEGSVLESRTMAQAFTAAFAFAPLTFAEPIAPGAPAARLVARDPRQALPQADLREVSDASAPVWQARGDLLSSGGSDRHFVAEIDDDGRARLRFGDGDLGCQPAAGAQFEALYRVGNGPAGNVGHDTICYIVPRFGTLSTEAVKPRNPLPATGGISPEPLVEAKLLAPGGLRARRERAITAEDYAELAARSRRLQGAAAQLRWTGSWHEARVAIDPAHSEDADAVLLAEIEAYLYRYRRMGHDLAVVRARYVPLLLGLEVCVLPHYARGHVKAALLSAFSNKLNGSGAPGFFNPDNLRFGGSIYLSQIVTAAMRVDGVETVKVSRLRRLNLPDTRAIETGVLAIGADEIAQLDNDPDFLENGRLELTLRGGR